MKKSNLIHELKNIATVRKAQDYFAHKWLEREKRLNEKIFELLDKLEAEGVEDDGKDS